MFKLHIWKGLSYPLITFPFEMILVCFKLTEHTMFLYSRNLFIIPLLITNISCRGSMDGTYGALFLGEWGFIFNDTYVKNLSAGGGQYKLTAMADDSIWRFPFISIRDSPKWEQLKSRYATNLWVRNEDDFLYNKFSHIK